MNNIIINSKSSGKVVAEKDHKDEENHIDKCFIFWDSVGINAEWSVYANIDRLIPPIREKYNNAESAK